MITQVDAEFKFQEMKKMYKELEIKGNGYKKRLDDLEIALQKHMEQYVSLWLENWLLLVVNDIVSCWLQDTERSSRH